MLEFEAERYYPQFRKTIEKGAGTTSDVPFTLFNAKSDPILYP